MKSLPIILCTFPVFLSSALSFAETEVSANYPSRVELECQSKKVFDAGYTVQITETGDRYFARVVELYGWSPDQVRFVGQVNVQVSMISNDPTVCLAKVKSIRSEDKAALQMTYFLGAEGSMTQLNRQEVGPRFGTLVCHLSPEFAEKYRECFR